MTTIGEVFDEHIADCLTKANLLTPGSPGQQGMITNCNSGGTGISASAHRQKRASCPLFIVSSSDARMQVMPIRRGFHTSEPLRFGNSEKSICYNGTRDVVKHVASCLTIEWR